MKKRIFVVALCASVLCGCGSSTASGSADSAVSEAVESATAESTEAAASESTEPATSESAEAAVSETSENTAESTQKVEQTEPLTVYLNDFDAVIPDLFKEKTGYDVEVVTGNGAETMSRIEAEKGNPQWDVVWMDSMYDIYNLDADGELLTGYTPENASGLTDFFQNLVPEDHCFYPTGAHAAGVLVYRNDIWSEEDAPKSFDDLSDPKYKDAVGMADPGVAAPAYPLAAYFMEQKGLEDGEAWFTSLFENGMKVYPKNPQVVKALSSGEISIAMLQESNAYKMVADGEPVTIVWPQEGAPASVRVAAISASTKQPEIAQAFVNFLLDPSVQQALVDTGDEGYFTPSVDGVNAKEDREKDPKLSAADVKFGTENEADIKAWFADYSAQ